MLLRIGYELSDPIKSGKFFYEQKLARLLYVVDNYSNR